MKPISRTRKLIGLVISAFLFFGGLALLILELISPNYVHGKFVWAALFPMIAGALWFYSDWIERT